MLDRYKRRPWYNHKPYQRFLNSSEYFFCITDVVPILLDIVNALAFSPFTGGPITMDHENTVKAYSASPSMLGRGHSLMEPQGPVWVR